MAEVRTIAVIGAGIMGRGIAHAAALGGYRTILEDILPTALRKAETEIRANLDKAVELGKVTKADADQAFGRLEYASSVEQAAREADLVIEAVPEEMESKIEIFTLLDKVCRPSTILASNTSSLSVTEIASVTYRAPKCVGMHFFNPVHKMKLLEIVRALETDDETLAAAVEVGKRMGKEVVVIKESPGFITSRINAMIGNEAFYMLQEGVASPQDIDKALKLGLNHPMGPFEMVDLVGLDTRLHILEYLHKTLGEKFRPAPLMVQYVKAGRLGRKAGRGVYEYPGQEPGRQQVAEQRGRRSSISLSALLTLSPLGLGHASLLSPLPLCVGFRQIFDQLSITYGEFCAAKYFLLNYVRINQTESIACGYRLQVIEPQRFIVQYSKTMT